MKQCTKCGETKPLADFNKRLAKTTSRCKACNRQRYHDNIDKNRKSQAIYRSTNRLVIRNKQLQKDYGITLEDYNRILKEQGDCCAICGSPSPGNKRVSYFHVDHNHETNEIRGLLCSGCNTAVGLIHDDEVVALRMFSYLSSEYALKRAFGIPVEFPAVKLARMEL